MFSDLHSSPIYFSTISAPPLRSPPTHNLRPKPPSTPRLTVVPSLVLLPPSVPPPSPPPLTPGLTTMVLSTLEEEVLSMLTTPMFVLTFVFQACTPVQPERLYPMGHTSQLEIFTIFLDFLPPRRMLSRSMNHDSLHRNPLLNTLSTVSTTDFTVKWFHEAKCCLES